VQPELRAGFLASLQNPVARASAYVNLYENMLNGRSITPKLLLFDCLARLSDETEELNMRLLATQLGNIFWQFLRLSPTERQSLAETLEIELWEAMKAARTPGCKKILFQAYQRVAFTHTAKNNLYVIWRSQRPPFGVTLTEDDYTNLALALAVRDYSTSEPLLPQQLSRITNVDRRQRLQFLMPALSPDVRVRDAFFASLKDEKNREKEAWVVTALGYLHHPLRAATSEKYLPESLALLEEIQLTGDIFFPYSWLQATFGSYQTPTPARTVRTFLQEHPTYNPKLRAKILQASDDLFRAEKLVQHPQG